jgi:hypothetical protein
MSTAENLLTSESVQKFERALFDSIPAVADFLQPGLSDAEIDEIVGVLPGKLPSESRVWWKWRNGLPAWTSTEHPDSVPWALGGGEFRLSSLQQCVESYQELREGAQELSAEDPEIFAPALWFPIDATSEVSIELAPEARSHSRVFLTDGYAAGQYGDTIADSLGEIIAWWTESFESGGLKWGQNSGWESAKHLVRPELVEWGFVP